MHKPFVLLLLVILISNYASAQSATIHGSIMDTIEKKPLYNASVLLLRSADSIMIRFSRTGKEGNFAAKKVPAGSYLFLVTCPTYADYVDSLIVKDSADIDLPQIPMVPKSALLQQVVVNGSKGGIRMKGDTIEFKADSFHTQAGATVEELLKKLPGIQVDKNGKITAQGEKVQKVLVDGEEFFGDDPTLVTQNLRADMVDKVQVYDKKSDQATFTGIDDGQRSKTIDLKLKANKKNGYFGKISAGAGTDGYYDAQVMLNAFRNKEKLAAYGIISNTGKTGLNWQERDKYGQSFAGGIDYDETTGGFSFGGASNDLDTWNGNYNGQGLPSVKTGGLHYNNKWDGDLKTFNGNYKVMQLNETGTSTTNSQYILPDTFYYNHQEQKFNNQILRHSADGSYEIKFDSTSTLKIMADGGTDHKITNNAYISEALASDSSIVNMNTRTTNTTGDNRVVNSNLLWRKKLPKKGRSLSVNLRENYSKGNSDGYLLSNTQFYQGGTPSTDSVIDQYKNYHTENLLLDSRINYAEPLSATSFLVANYGVSVNRNNSDRNSYNRTPGGKYTALDTAYSNNYQFNIITQKGGLAYSLITKKLRFNAGSNVGFSSFNQRDMIADTAVKRKFINWNPQASINYSFTSQQRLGFYYYGQTVQPSVQQIQPIRTNEDPLNITIGNPGLKPQFQNNFHLYYNDYKVLTQRGIFANAGFDFTQNAIASNGYVDTSGRRITQSINVNGNYNFSGYLGYNFKWKKPQINVDLSTNLNQSNNVSYVNNQLNKTISSNYTLELGLNKSVDKKFDLNLNSGATYTQSKSSINTGITTDYWSWQINPSLDIFFPLKFQLHADADVNLRQKTSVFQNNNNVTLLNAWIGKKFLKNDALLIKAAGNDLLDQNTGFNRTVNSNFITQNTYTTIRRYFLFSIVWNFTRAGATATGKGN
jgi:outer membrane beta-barrel protein